MPLPGVTMAAATCSNVSVFVMGSSPSQQSSLPGCPWHSANATASKGVSSRGPERPALAPLPAMGVPATSGSPKLSRSPALPPLWLSTKRGTADNRPELAAVGGQSWLPELAARAGYSRLSKAEVRLQARRHAPVHRPLRPSDGGGLVACKKQSSLGGLLGQPEAAQGRAVQQGLLDSGILQRSLRQCRLHKARRKRIDANSERRVFDGKPARQCQYRAFGGRVGDELAQAAVPHERRDVDERAAPRCPEE